MRHPRLVGLAIGACALLAAAVPSSSGPQQPSPAPSPSHSPGPPAGITSLTVFAGTSSGLYRSQDWGSTWQPASTPGKTSGLDDVGAVRDVIPIGPQVYLAGDGGVYQSEDFGQTWRRTDTGMPVVRVMPSRYPQGDPTVFAATPTGLLKSVDEFRSTAILTSSAADEKSYALIFKSTKLHKENKCINI